VVERESARKAGRIVIKSSYHSKIAKWRNGTMDWLPFSGVPPKDNRNRITEQQKLKYSASMTRHKSLSTRLSIHPKWRVYALVKGARMLLAVARGRGVSLAGVFGSANY
jgi:phage terminase large subunit-like protein